MSRPRGSGGAASASSSGPGGDAQDPIALIVASLHRQQQQLEQQREAERAPLEARLKAVKVAAADVEQLVQRWGLKRDVAERLLRTHGGNLAHAARFLVFGDARFATCSEMLTASGAAPTSGTTNAVAGAAIAGVAAATATPTPAEGGGGGGKKRSKGGGTAPR